MAFGLFYVEMFLSLYSSRKLQIINARYKNIEGVKIGCSDIKGFSYEHPKVYDFL